MGTPDRRRSVGTRSPYRGIGRFLFLGDVEAAGGLPFASARSRQRFERRHLQVLVLQDAVLFHGGRKLVDPERYRAVVLDLVRKESIARAQALNAGPTAHSIARPREQSLSVSTSTTQSLREWVLHPSAEERALRKRKAGFFSLDDAAERCLRVSPESLSRGARMRIGISLLALGCVRVERRFEPARFVYRGPDEAAGLDRSPGAVLELPLDAADLYRLREWALRPGATEVALRRGSGGVFSLAEVAQRCFGVARAELSRSAQTRLGMALQALGCIRIERRAANPRFVYWSPQEAGVSGAAIALGASLSSLGTSPATETGPRPNKAGSESAKDQQPTAREVP
jgi:hypothetical protein